MGDTAAVVPPSVREAIRLAVGNLPSDTEIRDVSRSCPYPHKPGIGHVCPVSLLPVKIGQMPPPQPVQDIRFERHQFAVGDGPWMALWIGRCPKCGTVFWAHA